MITEQDLQEAIAECQGDRNPNANTCIKLAAFYTIRDHLYPDPALPKPEPTAEPEIVNRNYSFAGSPAEDLSQKIDYYADTEFSEAIYGRDAADIWPLIDELLNTLNVLNPRLYDAFMRKLQ